MCAASAAYAADGAPATPASLYGITGACQCRHRVCEVVPTSAVASADLTRKGVVLRTSHRRLSGYPGVSSVARVVCYSATVERNPLWLSVR